jgi:hypothetical protein
MVSYSPSGLIKQIETQVNMILRKIDWAQVNEKGRKSVEELRQFLIDSKVYTHDYELSETRDEQLANARLASKWLEQARARILKASEHDIFGPVDVAHLAAQIDQVKADLK